MERETAVRKHGAVQALRAARPGGSVDARLALGRLEAAVVGTSAPPVEIGRYVVRDRIGAGGTGVVYVAHDPELQRDVAIKLIHPGRETDDELRARLAREAHALARLSHPNVVAVHDVGRLEDGVFVVMELVRGRTLRQWWAERPRSTAEIVRTLRAAGDGIAAAHDADVIHRDIKPENILVGDDGRVRVVDFGLARADGPARDSDGAVAVTSALTREGTLMGTPLYMAPEQHARAATDARTDQFSFCVTLFEALHGEVPFRADTLEGLARLKTAGRTTPSISRPLPGRVRRAIVRGLDPDPDRRFADMHALLRELAAPRRFRAVAALTVGAAVVVSAGLAYGLGTGPTCRTPTRALWSEADAAAVHDAILGTDAPYAEETWTRVDAALRTHDEQWAAAHHAACDAERDDPARYHLTMACLDGIRRETAGLTEVLSTADRNVVEHAAEAVHALTPVDACHDDVRLEATPSLADDPAAAARLARARALHAAGRYADARAEAQSAIEAARGDAARAEGWYRLGLAQRRLGEADDARASQWRALAEASRAGDAPRTAEIWIALLAAEEIGGEDGQRAAELTAVAEAAVERAGASPTLTADLDSNAGVAFARAGQSAEARRRWERCVELLEGEASPRLATCLFNLGNLAFDAGQHEESLGFYRRAHALDVELHGDAHPASALALSGVGRAQRALGDLGAARDALQQSLDRTEAALGSDHVRVGNLLTSMGTVLTEVGEDAEAVASYRRALAIFEATLGPTHPSIATAAASLGSLELWLDDAEGARTHHRRALEVLEGLHGADDVRVAAHRAAYGSALARVGESNEARAQLQQALTVLEAAQDPARVMALVHVAELDIAAGEPARARAGLERAASLLDEHPAVTERVAVDFAMARALAADGERDRGVALARQSLNRLGRQPGDEYRRAEIQGFIEGAGNSSPAGPPGRRK